MKFIRNISKAFHFYEVLLFSKQWVQTASAIFAVRHCGGLIK